MCLCVLILYPSVVLMSGGRFFESPRRQSSRGWNNRELEAQKMSFRSGDQNIYLYVYRLQGRGGAELGGEGRRKQPEQLCFYSSIPLISPLALNTSTAFIQPPPICSALLMKAVQPFQPELNSDSIMREGSIVPTGPQRGTKVPNVAPALAGDPAGKQTWLAGGSRSPRSIHTAHKTLKASLQMQRKDTLCH